MTRDTFFCGGFGDLITTLCWLPERPSRLALATSRAGLCGELANALDIPCRILESQAHYDTKAAYETYHGRLDAYDTSAFSFFPRCIRGELSFKRSEIFNLKLPNLMNCKYILVVPFTAGAPEARQMQFQDLDFIIKNTSGRIVVSGRGDYPVAENKRVLNLMNKTSLMESISLVTHAAAVFTVDTWQSVIAMQMDIPVYVKARNQYFYDWIKVYNPMDKTTTKICHFFV